MPASELDPTRPASVLERSGLPLVDGAEQFDRVARVARELLGADAAFLSVTDGVALHTLAASGWPERPTSPLGTTFASVVLDDEDWVVDAANTTLDDRFADLPAVLHPPSVRGYIGAPIVMRDGSRIGAISAFYRHPNEFTNAHRATISDLARWAEREVRARSDRDRLQTVLAAALPTPANIPGYTLHAVSIPAGSVSGDFHDWVIGTDATTFTIGDVMGKGVPSGLMAAQAVGAFRVHAESSAADAVSSVDRALTPMFSRAGAFATVFHGRLQHRTGRLDFVDAGHGLSAHMHDLGADMLESVELPLGLQPNHTARTSMSMVVRPGEGLAIATDGVLELTAFSPEELIRLARDGIRGGDPAGALAEWADSIRDQERPDDITVMLLGRAAD